MLMHEPICESWRRKEREYNSWKSVQEHDMGLVIVQFGDVYEIVAIDTDFDLIEKMNTVSGLLVGIVKRYGSSSNPTTYYTSVEFNEEHLFKNLSLLINAKYCVYQVGEIDLNHTLVKVNTPGTFESSSDTHICCIHVDSLKRTYNVSVVDIAIGNLRVSSFENFDELCKFVQEYDPIEVILFMRHSDIELDSLLKGRSVVKKYIDDEQYKSYFQTKWLKEVLSSVYEDSVFVFLAQTNCVVTTVVLLNYLHLCHSTVLKVISFPRQLSQHVLSFHNNAVEQLDLIKSKRGCGLLSIIDHTHTAMGKRLLRHQLLNPEVKQERIERLYDDTEEWMDAFEEYIPILKSYPDMDRLIKDITTQPQSVALLSLHKLYLCNNDFNDLNTFAEFLNRFNFETQCPRRGFNPLLDAAEDACLSFVKRLRCIISDLPVENAEVVVRLERHDKRGYPMGYGLFVDPKFLKTKQLFILKLGCSNIETREISKKVHQINNDYILEMCKEYDTLEDNYYEAANVFIGEIIEHVKKNYINLLKDTSSKIAYEDTIVSRCFLHKHYNYSRPVVSGGESFVSGISVRHPIADQMMSRYTGNGVSLTRGLNGMIIYGVNGSGKSTYGKSIALNLILAQAGFYVCADSFHFSPFTKIFTRINCDDNLYENKSTFIMELGELGNILKFSDNASFLIADELCKGTEMHSQSALVVSTVHALLEKGTKFIFASHLHELVSDLELVDEFKGTETLPRLSIKHMQTSVSKSKVVYERILCDGMGDTTYGLEVAKCIMNQHASVLEASFFLRATKMNNAVQLVSAKTSHFNTNTYLTKCAHCGTTENMESHHLNEQVNYKYQKNNKKMNHSSNLLVLCRSCHTLHHQQVLMIDQEDTPTGMNLIFHQKTKASLL
jgi:DNA mismatch repair protein MutS